MKIYESLEQGTEEWLEVRKGKITGSMLPKLISSKTLKVLTGETANSVLSGVVASKSVLVAEDILIPQFINGHTGEGLAKRKYQKKFNKSVKEVGFLESDCGRYGMSPDGLVGDEGFIEIKTMSVNIYTTSVLEDGEPALYGTSNYYMQILMGFIVNPNFKWCDFVMYNLSMDEATNFKVIRIERNEEHIEIVKKVLENEILPKLNEMENKFMEKFNITNLDI